MSDFGNDSVDAAEKKTGNAAGSAKERGPGASNNENSADAGPNNNNQEVSPFKWLSETLAAGGQGLGQSTEKLADAASKLILDKLPLILDAPVVMPQKEKSYSIVVDLDSEVARKLANAPQSVKDFYEETRQQQMKHNGIGLDQIVKLNAKDGAVYIDKWAKLNAWLAFPEEDPDCQKGRKLYEAYVKADWEKLRKGPVNKEEQKKAKSEDNKQLAKIYSLFQNDHDYLHNEDELTRRNGMHHLPDKFVGIGIDGKEKEFNLKALAEFHMSKVLQNTYKSPLEPDQRANLTFYSQVLRQVLPQELLDHAHKAEREKILTEYVNLYRERDYDLSQIGQSPSQEPGLTVWQEGMNTAKLKYPAISTIRSGLQLMDAESLYELFTLAEVRQLAVEAHEMRTLAGKLGKVSELAYPDQERLHEFGSIKAPMREYREGQVLAGRRFISTVFGATISNYGQFTAKEDLRLGNWQGTPNDWQMVYWHDNPNSLESKIQVEAHARFPRSLQCNFSNEGADLLRRWRGPQGLFGDDGNRLVELSNTLCDAKTKKRCEHNEEPREKGKIN